jgi:tetratricopeptide (TPR) repeat protein
MLDRTKTIAANGVVITAIALVLFAVNTQTRQWAQYRRGEAALKAGDRILAVAGYESAIHMYTPLSPLVERSADKLWTIGGQFEAQGDSEKALIAYRALRSAFYSTHGLFHPGTAWIDRCDEKIARLAKPVVPAK